MRTKAHRYSATVPAATFTANTECVGLTGDFDGGFVLATYFILASPGAGGYITGLFTVDGTAQGPNPGMYQSGSSLQITFAWTLRVPPGRHRIGVLFSTSGAPIASSAAQLTVTELNA